MLNSEGTSGWEFQGTNDAWTNGIIFRHMTSIKTDMSADGVADDDEIGKIFYHVDGFANDKWQSAAFDQSQSVLEIGAVKVNGNAPFIVWSEIDGGAGTDIDATYGSSIGAIPLSGFPNIDAVYKENILKSKGVFTVDPSLGMHSIPAASVKDAFNMFIDGDRTPPTACYYYPGFVVVKFLTPMPDDDYSVTMSYKSTEILNMSIESTSTTGFVAKIWVWDATPDWAAMDNTHPAFDFHFQVV